jgi:hypothetical protein
VIPCRDLNQFLAGSTRKSSNFTPLLRLNFAVLEAYIAGSTNWKLSLAESSGYAIDVTVVIVREDRSAAGAEHLQQEYQNNRA